MCERKTRREHIGTRIDFGPIESSHIEFASRDDGYCGGCAGWGGRGSVGFLTSRIVCVSLQTQDTGRVSAEVDEAPEPSLTLPTLS